jgi:hypothetical protein
MFDNLIQSLRELSKKSTRLSNVMRDYLNLKEEIVENAHILEKKVIAVSALIDDLPCSELKESLLVWLGNERKEIEQGKDEFKFQFGDRLRELFKKDGLEVRGQYPLLRFGLYTLKLNFELGHAVLYFGPEVEKLKSKITLQAEVIHDIVIHYEHEIKIDRGELENLARDLHSAYECCVRRNGRTYGEKILILDVLREYVFMKQTKKFAADARRENFREYPRIRLSYMLYQLRTNWTAQHSMRLHVATFDATVDKSRSFWVPDNEEGDGTHYEYISFEEPHE